MADAAPSPPFNGRIVNDLYWLNWAADSIDQGDQSLKASAERLTAAVGWFWTVYTAVAVVGVAFGERQFSSWLAVLIFLPVISLILAYLLALWVVVPVDLSYDPRNPSEIRSAYKIVMQKRRIRSGWALSATIISGLLVVLAGGSVAATQPSRVGQLHAVHATSTGGRGAIVASGQFDRKTPVMLRLTPTGDTGEPEVEVLEPPSASGKVGATIPVPAGRATAYDVTATWTTSDGVRRTITRNVKLGS